MVSRHAGATRQAAVRRWRGRPSNGAALFQFDPPPLGEGDRAKRGGGRAIPAAPVSELTWEQNFQRRGAAFPLHHAAHGPRPPPREDQNETQSPRVISKTDCWWKRFT